MRLSDRRIVLGVTGGIAAYKAVELLRLLRQDGATVHVVMTRSARRFVAPLTFAALTDQPVLSDLFARRGPSILHVDLAQNADLIAIVPATANVIGKVCAGIGDDLLSSVLLARRSPVLIAPSMNDAMWQNPLVQENIGKLAALGFTVVEPAAGELACGTVGKGRLAPVEAIRDRIVELIAQDRLLADRKVVVACGRTEEPIDPVRILTNRASGRLGFSLAAACRRQGAEVTLVCGETSQEPPAGYRILRARTSKELLRVLTPLVGSADILFMTVAVADYRPAARARTKLKEATLNLRLVRTDDVLARLAGRKTGARLIAFAVDTDNALARARRKLRVKGAAAIVACPVSVVGAAAARATMVFASGRTKRFRQMDKTRLAERIVEEAAHEFFRPR